MDRENGDNPNGWRSIYSDDGKPGSEEPRKNEQDGVTPSREATDGVPETAERIGPESKDDPAVERPAAAERGRPNPATEDGTALPPRRSSSPDVGVPRQFLTAEEEEREGKRKARTSSPDDEGETKPKKRRKKSRPLLWSFFIALFIVLATVGSLLFYVWNGLRPVSSSETPVRVTIAKGMRASSVSEELEKSGLIRNAFLFSGWLKLKNEGSRFQAGDYDMLPGMTRDEIVAKLNAGDTVAAETIRFTIPEGFTVEQIAERLSGEGFVDKTKFLAAAKNADAASGSAWTKQIPKDDSIRYPLEGYLFPETYELKKGATEEDIVNRMVAELDNKLNQLPDDWQSTMQDRGLTLHQLLTIASLVEREVVIDKERPIVAGIIENRLEKKMPLQIDATIQYVLGKQKEKLTTEDTKLDSPYNTYQHAGLPPGPIASPSYKSIEAALYPDDTDYLYYVTKKDGTNEHLFASTYKQHQKNIATSEKNAKK